VALTRVAEADEAATAYQEQRFDAEIHRLRGELLLDAENQAAAEASFRTAIDIARHQNAKLWKLRASVSLARLWVDQGKWPEARDLLAPVCHWFTGGFDTPDLIEAQALLDALR
jgi:predicted ATPase